MSKVIVTVATVLALASVLVVPTAVASECWQINTTIAGDGLRIIANAGQQIALGFVSNVPSGGIGMVLVVTPSACGGIGGPGQSGIIDYAEAIANGIPSFPALP